MNGRSNLVLCRQLCRPGLKPKDTFRKAEILIHGPFHIRGTVQGLLHVLGHPEDLNSLLVADTGDALHLLGGIGPICAIPREDHALDLIAHTPGGNLQTPFIQHKTVHTLRTARHTLTQTAVGSLSPRKMAEFISVLSRRF